MSERFSKFRSSIFAIVLLPSAVALPWIVSATSAEDPILPLAENLDRSSQSTIRNGHPLILRKQTTTDGVLQFDEPISVKVKNVMFRVPAAYLWPWPHQEVRSRVNEWTGLSFEFWMPDRRHLEISPLSNAESRPREPGRAAPGPDSYIVRVRNLRPTKLDEAGYVSPEQGFHNLTSIGSATISSFSFEDEPFGLVRFWQKDWPHPLPPPFINYRHKQGADPQALIKCNPPDRPDPNPLCSGNIHFVADDLAFFFYFPREELPHWQDIARAVRDLCTSWKLAT